MKSFIYIPVGDKDVLIDRQDYEWVRRMTLSITNNGYVYCTNSTLHRHVMNVTYDSNIMVDHINGNKLDNRRRNLRIANSHENTTNQAVRKIRKHSRFNGVSRDTKKNLEKPWMSSIRIRGVEIYLGYWGTEEEAALAYDKAVRKFLPTKIRKLNFHEKICSFDVPNLDYGPNVEDIERKLSK